MSHSTISAAIRKLYHIRKNDLEKILQEFPDNTIINVDTIKNDNISIEAYDVLEEYGIDTLFDVMCHLQEGNNIQDLYDVTRGSTSQYESNYKIEQHFLYQENDVDINVEEHPTGIPLEALLEMADHYSDTEFEYIHNDETGEVIRLDTVIDLMQHGVYHPLKIAAYCAEKYDCSPFEETVDDFYGSMLEHLLEDVPGEHTNGIITVTAIEGQSGDASFTIDRDQNTVEWSGAFVPAIMENPCFNGDYAMNLRVFNKDEEVEIINGRGEPIMVPRKYIAMWYVDAYEHTFNGIDASEASEAHSTDAITGEMIPPEEGVDFLTTNTHV